MSVCLYLYYYSSRNAFSNALWYLLERSHAFAKSHEADQYPTLFRSFKFFVSHSHSPEWIEFQKHAELKDSNAQRLEEIAGRHMRSKFERGRVTQKPRLIRSGRSWTKKSLAGQKNLPGLIKMFPEFLFVARKYFRHCFIL